MSASELRKRILPILFPYVLISFFVVPRWDAYYLFSSWGFFRYTPNVEYFDVTWNDGRSFLLRDHRDEAKAQGIDIRKIARQMSKRKCPEMESQHVESLKRFCKCEEIFCTYFEGSAYDHIILKRPVRVTRQDKM